jgi:hypothetical protein
MRYASVTEAIRLRAAGTFRLLVGDIAAFFAEL